MTIAKQISSQCSKIRDRLRARVRALCGMVSAVLVSMLIPTAYATDTLNTAIDTLSGLVIIAGGLIAAWGMVILGTNLKDHNGPGITNGIWTIVGGALVIAAAGVMKAVV